METKKLTPKQSVLELYPQAICVQETIIGTSTPISVIYRSSRKIKEIGNGSNPQSAWKDANNKLSLEEGTVADDDARIARESKLLAENAKPVISGDIWDGLDEAPELKIEEVLKYMETEFDKPEKLVGSPNGRSISGARRNAACVPVKRKPNENERRRLKRKSARNARKVNRK